MWRNKSKIRERIKEIALEEFSQKGFEKTTIREIAKKCEIPFASIYGYFKNKEEIFEQIIMPVINETSNVLDKMKMPAVKDGVVTEGFVIYFADSIIDYIESYKKQVILSLHGSKGTKFQDRRDHVINMITENILFLFEKYCPEESLSDFQHFRIQILATGIIDLLINLVRLDKDPEWMRIIFRDTVGFAYKTLFDLVKEVNGKVTFP
jgi:AcrR family transcriptional regulator